MSSMPGSVRNCSSSTRATSSSFSCALAPGFVKNTCRPGLLMPSGISCSGMVQYEATPTTKTVANSTNSSTGRATSCA